MCSVAHSLLLSGLTVYIRVVVIVVAAAVGGGGSGVMINQ